MLIPFIRRSSSLPQDICFILLEETMKTITDNKRIKITVNGHEIDVYDGSTGFTAGIQA
jgi:hypothetical protein